jgi:hypothetical protein
MTYDAALVWALEEVAKLIAPKRYVSERHQLVKLKKARRVARRKALVARKPEPRPEPDITELVHAFAPPPTAQNDTAMALRVDPPPNVAPRPSQEPTGAIKMIGKRQCGAVDAHSGRRCGLLEGHREEAHRTARGPFWVVAMPGQLSFARLEAIERIASACHGLDFGQAAAFEKGAPRGPRKHRKLAHEGANTTTGLE